MKSIHGTHVHRAGLRWGVALVLLAIGLGSCGTRAPKDEPRRLGAAAAGTPTASGPGVPADFAGHVESTMPLTSDERAAIERANALAAARNPPGHDPVDRGFGTAPRAADQPGAP